VIGLTTEQTKCLIRVDPDEDATSGFFVACLQRKNTTTNSSRRSTWELPTPPTGIEIYRGQFNTKRENMTLTTKIEDDNTTAVKKEEASTSTTGKRKMTESSDEKASKKKAKKVEWRRKQRLEKKERLLRQNKNDKNDKTK
jgi:hypothetical protein